MEHLASIYYYYYYYYYCHHPSTHPNVRSPILEDILNGLTYFKYYLYFSFQIFNI
jgi:hypothetical protein